jgi:hypothetical protein
MPEIVFRATRDITKGDILRVCRLLNTRLEYTDICHIEPEEICGGGLKFVFLNASHATYYKSVHLNIPWGKWGWIKHAMARAEWQKEKKNDLLFVAGEIKTFRFVAHSDAPAFTANEMFYWDECFARIGLVRAAFPIKNKKKKPLSAPVRSFQKVKKELKF